MKNIISTLTYVFCVFSALISGAQEIKLVKTEANNYGKVVHLSGDTVLASNFETVSLLVLDRPSSFKKISSFRGFGDCWSLSVSDSYAYYGGGTTHSLTVADIRNRQYPVVAATIKFSAIPFGACSYQNILYVTSNDTLFVIDMKDSSNPIFTDSIKINGLRSYELYRHDTLIHIATQRGIKTYSVKQPLAPKYISSFGGGYIDMAYDKKHSRIFASKGGNAGFDAIDYSAPENPKILFSGGNNLTGAYVEYWNDMVFQGTQAGGANLGVYNVSVNPPTLIDTIDIGSGMSSLAVVDSLFYSIDYVNLNLLRLSSDVSNNPEISSMSKSTQVYPNPISRNRFLRVEFESTNPKRAIVILNALGQPVQKISITEVSNSISVSHLNTGLFIYEVYDGSLKIENGSFIIRE